jgi:hypothetical protein
MQAIVVRSFFAAQEPTVLVLSLGSATINPDPRPRPRGRGSNSDWVLILLPPSPCIAKPDIHCSSARWYFYKSLSIVRRVLMSAHLSLQGFHPSRSIRGQRRFRASSNRCSVMPGTFKEWISSGVTRREHAYATSSSIGALSQCECPAGIFLVDLRRETRFAGSTGDDVTTAAGATGLPGAGPPWAVERGGTVVAGATGLPGAGPRATEGAGGITAAATIGLLGAGPSVAVERAGVTLVAGTTGLPGAGLCVTEGAGVTLAATTGLLTAGPPGAVEGGGGCTIVAGNVGSAGADGGGGITIVASSTGLSAAGLSGGIDGTVTFRRRAGISAGFATVGSALPSVPGLGAVSLRRRFGWEAATRGAFAFTGLGTACLVNSGGNGLPRRGAPRGSRQIHFTVPLPPSVRTRFFSSRRGNSSITHLFVKPVSLASTSILIWRLAKLGASALGAGINWINTRYRAASAGGIKLSSHSRSIFGDMLAGLDHSICSGLVRLVFVYGEVFKEIW